MNGCHNRKNDNNTIRANMDKKLQPYNMNICRCANHSWAWINIVKLKATYTYITMCFLQNIKPKNLWMKFI